MTLTDFIPNFVEQSTSEEYSFLTTADRFNEPQRASTGRQALIATAAATAFAAAFGGGAITGAIAGSNVGYADKMKKDELIADMQRMKEYCDLIAINLKFGSAQIRMLIDADEISGETLVGRFAMIHERGCDFQKYSMTIAKSWLWGDAKAGTGIQVAVVFSTHKKAREFLQTYADKCNHKQKGVVLSYFIVDLEDETITRNYSALNFLTKYSEKLEAGFFKKRS